MKEILDICCKSNQNNNLTNILLILKQIKKNYPISTQHDLQNFLSITDFKINDYISSNKNCEENSFLSNLLFWEDIELTVKQCISLKKEEKLEFTKNRLKLINNSLPASVYIPFKRSYNY